MTTRKSARTQRALRLLGVALLIVTAALVLNNLYVSMRAKEQVVHTFERIQSQMADATAAGSGTTAAQAAIAVDGKTYIGTLQIDSLELKLPVATEWRDEDGWSRLGSCRYSGTVADGNLVIAVYDANITGGLTRASDGDAVLFRDANGIEHSYTIASVETVEGSDFDALNAGSDKWDLTLIGPTFSEQNRIVLRCVS